MRKDQWGKLLSLAVLFPVVLFVAGLLAQLLINLHAWEAAGSDVNISPGLPSPQMGAVLKAIFTFPEGPTALAITLGIIALLIVWQSGIGRWGGGTRDDERNLTISRSGSHGTAGFLTRREAERNFEVTDARKTAQDILGAFPDGKVFTLGKDTRLNSNLAVCGASGTGKSRSISRNLIFQAARRGESVIITDPKSELYESMAPYLRDQGYIVKVFNLVNMDHSDSWNCLGEVTSELAAQTFAEVVLSNTSGDNPDPFWYSAELNLLKALVLYVATEEPEERRNFATIYDLLCQEREGGLTSRMKAASSMVRSDATGKNIPASPAWPPYSLYLQASEAVRANVIIGLGSKLQVLQNQEVRNITSYSEIDLELPGKKKCAYFCIVSDQDNTFNFLSSLFFSFLFIRLIHYADSETPNGMLQPKVKFVLDEFPNCMTIPDFTKKVSVIRSRGCSVAVFFQNIGQMKNRYPQDQWQEILGACDSTVFLGCTDLLSAQYFSDRTGVASVDVKSNARELNTLRMTNFVPEYRETNSTVRRQLMTQDEILRMPIDEELIFIRGMKPLQAVRFDYSKHPEYRKLRRERAVKHEPAWAREPERPRPRCSVEEEVSSWRKREKRREESSWKPKEPVQSQPQKHDWRRVTGGIQDD